MTAVTMPHPGTGEVYAVDLAGGKVVAAWPMEDPEADPQALLDAAPAPEATRLGRWLQGELRAHRRQQPMMSAEARQRAEVREELEAAERAAGEVVGRAFCASCGDRQRKALGTIRRSPAGLLFRAELRGQVGELPAELEEETYQLAHQQGERLPFVHAAVCRYLLERPPEGQDHPPRVECRRHGLAELDPEEVVGLVRGRRSSVPAGVLVHHPGQR